MSSHADTIRSYLGHRGAHDYSQALRSLDALLAENQRLQADLDRTTTAGNRIEQQLVEAASVMTALRSENQRLREALRYITGRDVPGYEPHMRPEVVAREALAGDAE